MKRPMTGSDGEFLTVTHVSMTVKRYDDDDDDSDGNEDEVWTANCDSCSCARLILGLVARI